MTKEDYYELLDVPPDATADRIREAVAAQRRYWTALMNHRDLERRQEAERILEKLKQAYDTLTDPARRASYDRSRAKGMRSAPASGSAQAFQDGVCPQCGTDNGAGASYCSACGQDLRKVCPQCGATMFVAADFCRICGTNYDKAIAAFERQAVEAAGEVQAAVREAERAKASLNQARAQRAAARAQDAARRAQEAARKAGTPQATAAASTAAQTAGRAEELAQETAELIEERVRRRTQRVLGVLGLIGLAIVLLVLAHQGYWALWKSVHYSRGVRHLAAGEWEAAAAELEGLLGVDPRYRDAREKLLEAQVEPYYRAGKAHLAAKEWEAARAELQQVVSVSRNYKDAQSLLADIPRPTPVVSKGLVGYWPFNGNANDESGNRHLGTVHGATLTFDRKGQANGAYNFNGVGDHILVPDHEALDFPNVSTICVWFKSFGGEVASLVTKYRTDTPEESGYTIGVEQGSVRMWIKDDLGGVFEVPRHTYSADEWTLACMVIDDGKVKGYVNGIYIGSSEKTATRLVGNSLAVLFGAHYVGWGGGGIGRDTFRGVIDEVRIYDRPLTEQEIEELYRE